MAPICNLTHHLTNAHFKKFENHRHAVALHIFYIRLHTTSSGSTRPSRPPRRWRRTSPRSRGRCWIWWSSC